MATHARYTVASLAVFAAVMFPDPGAATTVKPATDKRLAETSDLILVGVVSSRSPASVPFVSTNYTVLPTEVIKGSVESAEVAIRVPGGESVEGYLTTVAGAPEFSIGDKVLLFLTLAPDQTYRIRNLYQGAFRISEVADRKLAWQEEVEAFEVDTEARVTTPSPQRDLYMFLDWLRALGGGEERVETYWVDSPSPREFFAQEDFRLLTHPNSGLTPRWFEFDSGGTVNWYAYASGAAGLAGGGFYELQRAMSMWNSEPNTPIKLVYRGTSTSTAGLSRSDGRNVVLFGDPQSILDPIDCATGAGTYAIGPPWLIASGSQSFNGKRFSPIREAEIVVNDGIECAFSHSVSPSRLAEELFAHELGHTLGMAHSAEKDEPASSEQRDALMYWEIHDDGRGASPTADDQRGIWALYRKSSGGASGCPDGVLCLLNRRFQVTVSWSNQFDGTSGLGSPIKSTDLSGFFYFTDPSNIELMVKVLDFGSEIKIFYSQLTNLRFTMTVLDTYSGRSKTYSNTPGDCGAIDPNFLSSALLDLSDAEQVSDMDNAVAGSCRPSQYYLCLQNNRFEVWVAWKSQYDGAQGYGTAKKLSDLTGAFSFTDPANLELLIKTLDFGNKQLVLWGALSNLEYQITVTDTVTGKQKQYYNAPGRYCGGLDENF